MVLRKARRARPADRSGCRACRSCEPSSRRTRRFRRAAGRRVVDRGRQPARSGLIGDGRRRLRAEPAQSAGR